MKKKKNIQDYHMLPLGKRKLWLGGHKGFSRSQRQELHRADAGGKKTGTREELGFCSTRRWGPHASGNQFKEPKTRGN